MQPTIVVLAAVTICLIPTLRGILHERMKQGPPTEAERAVGAFVGTALFFYVVGSCIVYGVPDGHAGRLVVVMLAWVSWWQGTVLWFYLRRWLGWEAK